MFSLGSSEILIIAVVALLLFGPDKIPQLARTIGRLTREFNKYKDIMESTIRMEISRADGPTVDDMTVEERIAKAGAASQSILESRAASEEADRARSSSSSLPVADETDEEEEE